MKATKLTKLMRNAESSLLSLRAVNDALDAHLAAAGVVIPARPMDASLAARAATTPMMMRCLTCDTRYSSTDTTCPRCHGARVEVYTDPPPREYALAWYRED